jgi:hypothetical protein
MRRAPPERRGKRNKQGRGPATRHDKAATVHLPAPHLTPTFIWSAKRPGGNASGGTGPIPAKPQFIAALNLL